MDGFMDTMDALHSYQEREKKLKILADPHIGAFAVIMLAAYGLIYFGAFSQIEGEPAKRILCAGFFLSRCLCGISAASFPMAKKEGMLFSAAKYLRRGIVRLVLCLQGAACIGCMLFWSVSTGLWVTAAAFLAFGYYFYLSRKEFGGITGDTSGYFILLSEGCMIVAGALSGGR